MPCSIWCVPIINLKIWRKHKPNRSGIEIEKYRSKSQMGCYEILAQTSIALGDSIKAESAFKVLEKAPIDSLLQKLIILEPIKTIKIMTMKIQRSHCSLSQKFSSQPYWAAKVYLWPKTFTSRMPFKPHTFWNPWSKITSSFRNLKRGNLIESN